MSSIQKAVSVLSSILNYAYQTLTLSTTNITTMPHITIKEEINQRVVYYLLDCSAIANFISKSFVKKLNLIPIFRLNELVRGLDGKILSNTPYTYTTYSTLFKEYLLRTYLLEPQQADIK